MVTARLRLPFFLLALLAIAAVVLLERGSSSARQAVEVLLPILKSPALSIQPQDLEVFPPAQQEQLRILQSEKAGELAQVERGLVRPPGFAIQSMAFVDGSLLFTILLMGLSLLLPQDLHARIQGIITLVFAILLIIAGVALILVVLLKLMVMVALLLSFPFGTLFYLLVYGHFPRSAGMALLGALFALKIVFGALLLLAHQDFIKNTGLVLFLVGGFIANLVVSFLYGLVPGILVSITDAIAAIVVIIIGIILGIILLIGAIPSILKVVKL